MNTFKQGFVSKLVSKLKAVANKLKRRNEDISVNNIRVTGVGLRGPVVTYQLEGRNGHWRSEKDTTFGILPVEVPIAHRDKAFVAVWKYMILSFFPKYAKHGLSFQGMGNHAAVFAAVEPDAEEKVFRIISISIFFNNLAVGH